MRLVRFRRMNVLRPRAEADKARGKRTQWRKPLKEPGQKRERISIFGFASGHYSAMNESLHCLDHAGGQFTTFLHLIRVSKRGPRSTMSRCKAGRPRCLIASSSPFGITKPT